MPKLNLKALRVAAEGATPGPWHAPGLFEVHNEKHDMVAETTPSLNDEDYEFSTEQCDANAAFIAAANPSTILKLIARLEASERDGARYRQTRTMPFTLDPSRIAPVRPDKFDQLIDAQIAARKK